jgi:site-specific DNA recombinase
MSRRSENAVRSADTARARAAARGAAAAAPAPTATQCVVYARVSSKDQEKEDFSIPAQLRLLHEHAASKGLAVAGEYIDVETAKRAGRTHSNKMLAFMRENPACRTIVVEKTDRLYRNISDWVTLDALKLDVHLVKEGVVLSEESRSSEKFIHGIKVLMAKNYIDNLSEEVKKGMREKATQGIWPGPAPLGYRNVIGPGGKKIIEVDPIAAPLMIKLFEAYATGDVSLSGLAKLAKELGLKSKKGNPLQNTAIWFLIQNPLFMGEYDWEGQRIVGTHQPLIAKDLYEQVQCMLTGRAQVSRTTQFRDFAFSGILRCGLCDAEGEVFLLCAEMHRGKYTYYSCTRCKKLKRSVYHKEADISALFIEAFRKIAIDADAFALMSKALLGLQADMAAARDREAARINKQIAEVRAKVDRAYDDRLEGRIPVDVFDRKSAAWKDEVERLQNELSAMARADAPPCARAWSCWNSGMCRFDCGKTRTSCRSGSCWFFSLRTAFSRSRGSSSTGANPSIYCHKSPLSSETKTAESSRLPPTVQDGSRSMT